MKIKEKSNNLKLLLTVPKYQHQHVLARVYLFLKATVYQRDAATCRPILMRSYEGVKLSELSIEILFYTEEDIPGTYIEITNVAIHCKAGDITHYLDTASCHPFPALRETPLNEK